MSMMDDRQIDFCERLRSTERDGVEEVIGWLGAAGFFKAPASTRFHLSHKGGLVEHSLNVCDVAMHLREMMISMDGKLTPALPVDSVVIAALLHDVCKADIYKPVAKSVISVFDRSGRIPDYTVDYKRFPLGHGEKSVILLQYHGLKMTPDEMMAIRWHMSAWDLPFQSPELKANLNAAKDICPLLTLVSAADGLAAGLLENKRLQGDWTIPLNVM